MNAQSARDGTMTWIAASRVSCNPTDSAIDSPMSANARKVGRGAQFAMTKAEVVDCAGRAPGHLLDDPHLRRLERHVLTGAQ